MTRSQCSQGCWRISWWKDIMIWFGKVGKDSKSKIDSQLISVVKTARRKSRPPILFRSVNSDWSARPRLFFQGLDRSWHENRVKTLQSRPFFLYQIKTPSFVPNCIRHAKQLASNHAATAKTQRTSKAQTQQPTSRTGNYQAYLQGISIKNYRGSISQHGESSRQNSPMQATEEVCQQEDPGCRTTAL